MSGSAIREMFLKFFEGKGHTRVHSSSLVPHNDHRFLPSATLGTGALTLGRTRGCGAMLSLCDESF